MSSAQVQSCEAPADVAQLAPAQLPIWAGAQILLDSLPGQAAVLDVHGVIRAVNRAWCEFGNCNAGADGAAWVGHEYLRFCGDVSGLETLASAIADVASGVSSGHVAAYDCSAPNEWRWFQVRVIPLKNLDPYKVLVIHDNVSPAIHALGDVWRDFGSLSPREKQVFSLVAKGMSNKEMAFSLGVAEKTVESHRASVMVKMRAKSLADLVRRAVAIEVALGQCELFGQKQLIAPPRQ